MSLLEDRLLDKAMELDYSNRVHALHNTYVRRGFLTHHEVYELRNIIKLAELKNQPGELDAPTNQD